MLFRIDYSEEDNDAHLKLHWNYTDSSAIDQIIPSSYLYHKQMIGSAPVTADVTCPEYYTHDHPDHPGECYEICGDGVKIGRVSLNFLYL